jgi:glycosyltransferase involved in cell wall biosynthesis
MRLLVVVDGLWVGGTERSLVELLPYYRSAGIETTVACFRRHPDEGVEGEVRPEMARVVFLDGWSLGARVRALRRLLRSLRPDVLHTSLFTANLAGRLASVGLPVVVLNSLVNTSYEPVQMRDPALKPWRVQVVRFLDALTGRLLTDHWHAVSHAVAGSAARRLKVPRERVTVVERGRDPSRLGVPSADRRRTARERLGLPGEACVLVNVGRQDYQKGQDCLLSAVVELRRTMPGAILLVVGRSGSASARLERQVVTEGLEEQVRFLGHRADVPDLLAAADVFVFPSLFEGFPGAVVEAMALALPVVAADIEPVRELVVPERTGLLVPPGDPTALAASIARLLAAPELAAALGAAGRRQFEERFTLDVVAPRMVAMLRTLAESGPRDDV